MPSTTVEQQDRGNWSCSRLGLLIVRIVSPGRGLGFRTCAALPS